MDGTWIQTYSGVKFHPLNPNPDDINLKDIAHALSMQCRFSGHCKWHYSVAQHSVHVSMELPPEMRVWGLLHDASEAYLVDLPRPLKRSSEMGSLYMEIEERLMRAVAARFDLQWPMPDAVHDADNALLMAEKRDLMGASPEPWIETMAPVAWSIPEWSWPRAEWEFLATSATLGVR